MCPAEANLFKADGRIDRLTNKQADEQTDVTNLIDADRNFAHAPTEGLTVQRVTVEPTNRTLALNPTSCST